MVLVGGMLIAGLLGFAIFLFNRLVGLRNRADAAWSDIDVQLKRRHDLVDNLVQTVKGYTSHERETLEEVTRLRAAAEGARSSGAPDAAGEAEARLYHRVQGLFAVAEAYPDLKSSEQYLELHQSLVALENDLQNARRYYNAVVRDHNTRIQSVPDLVLARPLGFRERRFFELEDRSEGVAPRIDLGRSP
jgi:LemA protein